MTSQKCSIINYIIECQLYISFVMWTKTTKAIPWAIENSHRSAYLNAREIKWKRSSPAGRCNGGGAHAPPRHTSPNDSRPAAVCGECDPYRWRGRRISSPLRVKSARVHVQSANASRSGRIPLSPTDTSTSPVNFHHRRIHALWS